MNLDTFERYPLLFGPSPVHRLERLTSHLGGAQLWAKRDDCNSGLAYGGNKTRKLEYLVADALAQGCDTLVSIGGVQSNHTRQVAAVAARTGMKCVLVQESWVDWPDVVYDRVGNIHAQPHHGRRRAAREGRLRHRLQGELGAGAGRRRGRRRQALRDPGRRVGPPARRPRLRELGAGGRAPGGASSASSSTRSIVCSVTGSTQAGMIAGFAAQERERRVIGIDGSAKPQRRWEQVARIARATAELIEVGRELRDDEIILDDRYHAGTYGIPDDQTLEAIRLAGRLEGMITDPVYEGKSMAGMIDLVTRGEIAEDSNVLYAHLGGQPALSAYGALFSA